MLRFVLSWCLLAAVAGVHAQKKKVRDTTQSYVPTGVRVGMDLFPYLRQALSSPYSGYEINADLDFYRYYLAFDYGQSSFKDSIENGYYSNNGTFWRLGGDVNFLLKDPDRNMIFLGVRVANATFSNEVVITTENAAFGRVTQTIQGNDGTASWRELTGGLRVKVWKWLWMGYTFRYKFGLNIRGNENLQPYDVPGFGRTFRNDAWGANYQVFIKIPVRKQPAPPPKK
jgi:hypothetical protein